MRSRGSRTRARTELIEIQQRIVERLKNEIEESLEATSPVIQIYHDEYLKELERFERISSKRELVEACAAADIVYCGDYHTLSQSQDTAAKLIRELLSRKRAVTVALEMVASEHQGALERYLAGSIQETEFLNAIDYRNSWDFQWEPYRRLLDLCRREQLPVIAINSDPEHSQNRVIDRDFHAAQIIADETIARPDRVVFVLDGDLHVARDHLPLIVDSTLRSRGVTRSRVIVHQNAEPVYWRLAKRGLEREAHVVKLAHDCYCVLSATPLVKLQSYLNWEQNHAELCAFVHPDWRLPEPATDFTEQMHELVSTIAGFLEIRVKGLDEFSVYTTSDLDFLEKLESDPRFPARELAEIKRQMRAGNSYFIPRANIIYLADLSTHSAAEEAAHFVNTLCSGFSSVRRDARDALYYRAVKEALGFLGSRIIDHKRCCMTFDDLRTFLLATRASARGRRRSSFQRVAQLCLRHRDAERRWLRRRSDDGRALRGLHAVHVQPRAVQDGVAHLLGYILGDKLHNALVSGIVNKKYIRELFHDPLPPGAAETRYFELVARLEGIDHAVPAEHERF